MLALDGGVYVLFDTCDCFVAYCELVFIEKILLYENGLDPGYRAVCIDLVIGDAFICFLIPDGAFD